MESLNRETASYAPPPQVPMQSSSSSLHYCYASPSPTRPGLSASIYAPSPIRRRGLSASIHASSSPSEEDAPSYPPRPDSSASIHAPKSPPWRDSSSSIHAPRTSPKRGLNASIHAPPSRQESMEPVPIPVVDLSPERRTPRLIDPKRDCDLIVLVDGGSVYSVSP
jgi:hypothetical protein